MAFSFYFFTPLLPPPLSPPPPLLPSRQTALQTTIRNTEKEKQHPDGKGEVKGVGEEQNHTTARKPGPL
jgi:hypothetical protein